MQKFLFLMPPNSNKRIVAIHRLLSYEICYYHHHLFRITYKNHFLQNTNHPKNYKRCIPKGRGSSHTPKNIINNLHKNVSSNGIRKELKQHGCRLMHELATISYSNFAKKSPQLYTGFYIHLKIFL